LTRRAYGRDLKHEGLLSATATDKVKNLKVKEMSGAKIKQISENALITNDSDSQFGATSAYLNQANEMIERLNILMMTRGGGPWPSSVGIHTVTVSASGTSKVYAENCYLNTTQEQSATNPTFRGVIRIHAISIKNSSGSSVQYTAKIKGNSGDGQGGTEGEIMLADATALANGRSASVLGGLTGVTFDGGLYLGQTNQAFLELQEGGGAGAYTASIYYSVYSYGGQIA